MKLKAFFCSFYCFFSVAIFAQPVTDGLVGFWPFNGNTADASGNGLDGEILGVGSYLAEDRFGDVGSAYGFTSTETQGIVNHDDRFKAITNTFSVSFWAFTEITHEIDNQQNSGYGGTSGQNFAINPRNGSSDAYAGVSVGTNGVGVYEHGNSYMPAVLVWEGSMQGWNHIVIVYRNRRPNLYINGVFVKQGVRSGRSIVSPCMEVGKAEYGPYSGIIDDVLIYDRDLADSEILQLFNFKPSILCSSIYCDGSNIGIGASDTKGYKLAVAGNTITEEVNVSLIENWPDYVFEDDYEIRPLNEVKSFIDKNGHLPDVPRAEEVIENGINLGEMDSKLLLKIEELTLYLIEQNNRIQFLEKEIEKMRTAKDTRGK